MLINNIVDKADCPHATKDSNMATTSRAHGTLNDVAAKSHIEDLDDTHEAVDGDLGISHPHLYKAVVEDFEAIIAEANWHRKTWKLYPRNKFVGPKPDPTPITNNVHLTAVDAFLLFWYESIQRKITDENLRIHGSSPTTYQKILLVSRLNSLLPYHCKRGESQPISKYHAVHSFFEFENLCGRQITPSLLSYWEGTKASQ